MQRLTRFWDSFVLDTLRETRQAQVESIPSSRHRRAAMIVLGAAALFLVFREEQYRYPWPNVIKHVDDLLESQGWQEGPLGRAWSDPRNQSLIQLSYWSIWQFLTYVIGPVLVVKILLRDNLGDYGVKIRGALKFWWAYLAMYLALLPLVLLMSQRDSFQHTYPFFTPADVSGAMDDDYWPRFFIWQFFYALQFVSLEFFFRGFLLHGTKRLLGVGSIFVMMIPYCMIHFGKPLPETLGALVAGLVLGFMSLKTRSIWLGAASHIGVALTMDLAALSQMPR